MVTNLGGRFPHHENIFNIVVDGNSCDSAIKESQIYSFGKRLFMSHLLYFQSLRVMINSDY